MRKNTKKGFTLVELLVVVAIVAILATVSVVAYLSFTEKAKQSNDEVLVKQLNTLLQADETLDGKPTTMSGALDVLKENGYVVEKLTPTSTKNEFLYSLSNNRFEIKSKDDLKALDNGDYWYIVEDEATLNEMKSKCSIYLIDTLSLTTTEVTGVKYGFDALNTNATKLSVSNTSGPSNIVLNTNVPNISVDAADDNVNHYGTATNVDITAVAPNSYHEYGVVNTLKALKGHISFEKNSSVITISVAGNDVSVTISEHVINPQDINIYKEPGITGGNITKPSTVKETINKEYISTTADINYNNINTYDKINKVRLDKYFLLKNDLTISTTDGFFEIWGNSSNSKYSRKFTLDLNGHTLFIKGVGDGLSEALCVGESQGQKLDCEIINGTINYDSYNAIRFKSKNLKITNCNVNFTRNIESSYVGDKGTFINLNYNYNGALLVLDNINFNGNSLFKYNNVADYLLKYGTVIINSGSYTSNVSDRNLVENKSNLTINGGTFTANADGFANGTIYNIGTITINSGTFNCTRKAALYNEGKAELNGGTFNSKSCPKCDPNLPNYTYAVYSGSINNTSSIIINNGVIINGVHGGLAVTSGAATINGGRFTTVACENKAHDTSHYALYLAGETGTTSININGGEFTSYNKVAMYVGNGKDGGLKQPTRVFVTGGTFNGNDANKSAVLIDNANGYLEITGGKYSSNVKDIISSLNTTQQGNYWVVS